MSDELEQRLQALRPAEPSPDLMHELLAAEPPAPGKVRWIRFAVPLSAAAALALAFVLWHRPQEIPPTFADEASPSDVRVFLPVEKTSTLIGVQNVALIDRDPARPYRLVSRTWLDDVVYAGDDGQSTLRRKEPRTEIIPVALETF